MALIKHIIKNQSAVCMNTFRTLLCNVHQFVPCESTPLWVPKVHILPRLSLFKDLTITQPDPQWHCLSQVVWTMEDYTRWQENQAQFTCTWTDHCIKTRRLNKQNKKKKKKRSVGKRLGRSTYQTFQSSKICNLEWGCSSMNIMIFGRHLGLEQNLWCASSHKE